MVKKARAKDEACADGSITRAEAFVELFSHLIFHLQGSALSHFNFPRLRCVAFVRKMNEAGLTLPPPSFSSSFLRLVYAYFNIVPFSLASEHEVALSVPPCPRRIAQ